MKILIIGNGGREHALLWKLRRDHPDAEYLITKGNGGTGALARSVPVDPGDVSALLEFASAESIDFTVVGPEVPLAAGLTDAFRQAGLGIFGPSRGAARLESSKAFAKRLMADCGVPSARFEVFTEREPAAAFAAELGIPCVVKASGLAAGKGAIVCDSEEALADALDACFVRRDFGDAGEEVVVEECLEGEELSMIAVSDGEAIIPLITSQDHKRVGEGDTGANTGGMGAYAPVTAAGETLRGRILTDVFRPTLEALAEGGAPFQGCMYAGLMLTASGPQVLEWNVRFGDPETQALLPLLESDLLELLMAASGQGKLTDLEPRWSTGAAITVVAAAEGYPGSYSTGIPIEIPEGLSAPDSFDRRGVVVFHAGTRTERDRLVTSGGRVLNVTAVGVGFSEARERAYESLDEIRFEGMHARRDIGWREMERVARRAVGPGDYSVP